MAFPSVFVQIVFQGRAGLGRVGAGRGTGAAGIMALTSTRPMVILMVGARSGVGVPSEEMDTGASRDNVTCGCTTAIAGVEDRIAGLETDSGGVMFLGCGTSNETTCSSTARLMICSSVDRLSCLAVGVEVLATVACSEGTSITIGVPWVGWIRSFRVKCSSGSWQRTLSWRC